MSIRPYLLLTVVLVPTIAWGAIRTFTDHEGNTLKAEFTGVKDGQVILKEKGTRKSFPLSAFTMEDRDFIVKSLLDRKQEKLLEELMNYAVQNSREAVAVPNGGLPGGEPPIAGPVTPPAVAAPAIPMPPISRFPNGIPPAVNVPENSSTPPAVVKSMYGLTLPTEELIAPPQMHVWTDLRGEHLQAAFEQVVSPGVVILKPATGLPQRVPLVNLSREDVEFIKASLESDKTAIVFPAGEFKEPTPEELSAGARVWTDRRGEKLTGKYVRRNGRETVIDVGGTEKSFPTVGLSPEDKLWVNGEEQRRQEELRRQQAAAQAAASQQAAGAGGFPGRNPSPGMGPGAGGPGSRWSIPTPQYEFHCRNCSNRWTSSSPIDQCQNCKDLYQFRCFRCGHSWTRKGQMMDKCPNCSGELGNGGATNPAGTTPVANNAVTTNAATTSPSNWNSGESGGSSSYRSGRLVGKIFGWVFGLAAAAWGINKARG